MNSFLVVLLIAFAGTALGYHGHGHHYDHHDHYDHYDHGVPTSYKFEYGVKDPHTHDFKSQWEHGDGGHHVNGAYQLHEPDGTTRHVHYAADGHGGFHAHVTKHGHYHHPYGGKSYHNFNMHSH